MAQALERERKLYTILGLEDGVSIDEVRKAYKQMALQCHPDKNPTEEAAEQFKLINHAHQVLTDPQRKSHYDNVILNSEAVKFAQRAYKETHFKDVDEARRQREQELYRKRANRDSVRQGEMRRGGERIPDEKKEFLAKRDKEREKELATKLAKERELSRLAELERQRRGETARQRTEEGRKREAERRARLDRDKQMEKERHVVEEDRRRERLESEKLRQEEARKRELERQMVRRQKQLEKLKDQRKLEEEQMFRQSLSNERAAVEQAEEVQRKQVLAEQLRMRRSIFESGRLGHRSINDHAERCDIENDEAVARDGVSDAAGRAAEFIGLCVSEWSQRAQVEDDQIIARSGLARQCVAGLHYWEWCGTAREKLADTCIMERTRIVRAEQAPRVWHELQHKEVQYRVDLLNAQHTGAQYILTQMHVRRYHITARRRLAAAEAEARVGVVAAEDVSCRKLAAMARVLALMRQESVARRQVEIAAVREMDESNELAALRLKRREEEERRVQREFDLQLRVEALEREAERLRHDNQSLRSELSITSDCLSEVKAQSHQQVETLSRKMASLQEENQMLRTEIKSFNTGSNFSLDEMAQSCESTVSPAAAQPPPPPRVEHERSKSPPSPAAVMSFTRQRTRSPTTPATPVVQRKRSNSSKTPSASPAMTKRSVSKLHGRRRSSNGGVSKSPKEGARHSVGARAIREESKSSERHHTFAACISPKAAHAPPLLPNGYSREGMPVARVLTMQEPNVRQF